ncbi:MAG: ribonuclease domain-containing protein [Pirellulales bacterium]
MKLKLGAIVVLIVGAVAYNWYEKRSESRPAPDVAAQTETKPQSPDVAESNAHDSATPTKAQQAAKPKAKSTSRKTAKKKPEQPTSPSSEAPASTLDSKPDGGSKEATSAAGQKRPPTASPDEKPQPKRVVVENVTIKDLDGKVIYRGQIDLQPTIDRIAEGKHLRFANDGSTFQNREGRLPRKPAGYYQEWVHPTEEQGGPGPQRIVTGKGGEMFYTHDHYRSFRKIK